MRQALRSLLWRLGLAGVLLLALVLGLRLRGARVPAEPDAVYSPAHRRLLGSLGPVRPIAGRLSGQQVYRPYSPLPAAPAPASPSRGAAEPSRGALAAPALDNALDREIRQRAARHPSPESLATLGVLELVEGRPEEAVRRLREAQAGRPDDPNLQNDLAGSLLAEAERTGDPRPALEALEEAGRSLRTRPSTAARFNAALALERLGLRAGALGAWQSYLQEDGRSEWGAEAAARHERLAREIPAGPALSAALARPETAAGALGQNAWADRLYGERTLLGLWAERSLAGDRAGARQALAQAEAVAASLTAGGGRLLAAATAALRAAEKAGDPERLLRLARGHQAVDLAFRRQRAERSTEACRLVRQAEGDLAAGGSPFALAARLLHARWSPEAQWAEIESVDREARDAGYPTLVAEARREAAYRRTLEGRFPAALDAYEDARRLFAALREEEMVTLLSALRADLFDGIGNERLEMAELKRALFGAPAVSDPWNRYSVYIVAAGATAGLRQPAVALRREAAEVCKEMPERPLCPVDSLLGIARTAPDPDLALETLEHAGELLGSVAPSDGRERTALDLLAVRARLLGAEDRPADSWEQAAGFHARAAERYLARGLVPSAAGARAERARVLERLGRSDDAKAEYRQALELFRRWDRSDRFRPENAEKKVPPELRGAYQRLLRLELDAAGASPSRAAFLLAEEMRDHLAPRRAGLLELPQEADLERWLAAIPPGTAVVEYSLAGEGATAWVLAGGRFEQIALKPGAGVAGRLRALGPDFHLPDWKRITGELFHDLLAPVLARLPAGTQRLVVVPDAELYGLPFRALWNPEAGRYLDEDLAVVLAPSVRMALDRPAAGAGPLPLLSVGYGEFAEALGLDPLPQAPREAADVRALYGGEALGCAAGGWEELRRCAPRAAVLHLATHAAADSTPGGTWLALPRETVTLDRLWRELPELPGHPLVVLSSCQSVASGASGEGLGGLARPFLASGARAVVGTLWPVGDAYAARLFPAFHRAYRLSGDVAQALRAAREALPGWREQPWRWGGVEAVGF